MNCNRFRFLVQQRFDTEISPQDDRALLIHLETCESCQKFHHQVQQVILAAEELPIQDDLLPIKLESLARRVMEQLPQPKANILDNVKTFIQNINPRKNGAEKSTAATKVSRQPQPTRAPSPFPHRSQQPVELEEELPVKRVSDEQLEEMRANSGKLKAFAKGYQELPIESRDAQSTTRSLSEKFGLQSGASANADAHPLTLAESIKRKISESQRMTHDPAAVQEEAARGQQIDLWGKQTGFPNMPPQAPPQPGGRPMPTANQGGGPPPRQAPMDGSLEPSTGPASNSPSVLGTWGKPSPIDSSQWGIVSTPAEPGAFTGGSENPYEGSAGTASGAQANPYTSGEQPGLGNSWGEPWAGPGGQTSVEGPTWPTQAKEGGWQQTEKGQQSWTPPGTPSGEPMAPPQQSDSTPSFQPGFNEAQRPNLPAWGEIEQPAANAPSNPAWDRRNPVADWGAQPANPRREQPNQPAQAPESQPWDKSLSQAAQKQPPIGSWTDAGTTANWQPGAPEQPAMPNQPAGGWERPAASKLGEMPLENESWSKPSTAPIPAKKPAWSAEAEQIETGTWQAFYPMDSLGTPSTHATWNKGQGPPQPNQPSVTPPASPQQPPAADPNQDWDLTIQEKLARQRGAASEAAAGQPPDLASTFGQWDSSSSPAREQPKSGPRPPSPDFWQMQEESQGQPSFLQKPEQLPPEDAPRPKPAKTSNFDFATQSLAGLANSVMDKLGSMLGDKHASHKPGNVPPVSLGPTKPGALSSEKPTDKPGYSPLDLWGSSEEPFAEPSVPPSKPRPKEAGFDLGLEHPAEEEIVTPISQPFDLSASAGQVHNEPSSYQAPPAAFEPLSVNEPPPELPVSERIPPPADQLATSSLPMLSPQDAYVPPPFQPPAEPTKAQPQAPAPKPPEPSAQPGSAGMQPRKITPVTSSRKPTSSPQAPEPTPIEPEAPMPAAPAIEEQISAPPPSSYPASALASTSVPLEHSIMSTPQMSAVNGDMEESNEEPSPSATWAPPEFNLPPQPAASIPSLPDQRSSQTGVPIIPTPPAIAPKPVETPAPVAQPVQPVAQQPQPAAPVETPASLAERRKNAGLFVLNDNDIDKLFSENLGVNENAANATRSGTNIPTVPPTPTPPDTQSARNTGQNLPPASAWPFPPSPPAGGQSTKPAAANQGWAPPEPTPATQWPAWPAPQQGATSPSRPSDVMTPPEPPRPAAPQPQPQSQPAAASAEPPAKSGDPDRLFSLDPSIIDKIFTDHLGVSEQAQAVAKIPKMTVNEAVKAISDVAASIPQQPPPKIEGLGRLDARIDDSNEVGSGRIASIGKFLLDGKDLEKIGKITASDPSDTKMRILTLEGAAELTALLQRVGQQPGVVGSVIIGHDGLPIANTMPPDMDAASFGALSHSSFMATLQATEKLGGQRVHQIVSRTERGYLIITDFGNGLLVTASDAKEIEYLIPLMRIIKQLVAP